jgi:kynurenine formamidase
MSNNGTYDGSGADSPQWWPSRYGADDEAGAANELTPERTLAALKLAKEGRVVSIAQDLHPGAPAYGARTFYQAILAHETLHQFAPEGSQTTAFEEIVTQTYHVGCHIDGLGHVGIAGRHYNGLHHTEYYTPTGFKKYGADTMPQWVTRGVCLDIAGLEGTTTLPEGYVITPEHLDQAQERQGVEVGGGDAVLLHTGWGELWDDSDAYTGKEPGCGWDAAHWLTDRRVSVVAADNWGFEVMPFEDEQKIFAVHQHLLAETGTFIVENIRTSGLVADGISEFLFFMAPNKVRGATGSMVNPVVVV